MTWYARRALRVTATAVWVAALGVGLSGTAFAAEHADEYPPESAEPADEGAFDGYADDALEDDSLHGYGEDEAPGLSGDYFDGGFFDVATPASGGTVGAGAL